MAYRMTGWLAGVGFVFIGACSPAMAQDAYVPLQSGAGVGSPVPVHHHFRHHGVYNADHRGHATIGYGETIISGRTGQHRSILTGVMVPDSEPPDFVLTGRAPGSGPGANGFPGSNQ